MLSAAGANSTQHDLESSRQQCDQTIESSAAGDGGSKKLSKMQEDLLQQVISFETMDMKDADSFKAKLYDLFFNWE